MKLLILYLKRYKSLIVLTLLLAAINQCFSLFDPMLLGKVIDNFGSKAKDFAGREHDFIKGVSLLIGALVGVAFISRTAKAFQDYTLNIIIQKIGAEIYTDGLKHSLLLPFQEFEDQQSGTTLNILQKVRIDTEKFLTNFINVFYIAVIGIVFVFIYSIRINALLIFVYLIAAVLLGTIINYLSKKIKIVQTEIVRETNQLAGTTTESLRNIELIKSLGLTHQELHRLKIATLKILGLELKKVRSIRSISFAQGTIVNFLRQSILFFLLYLIFRGQLTLGQLITFQFYSFFIFNPIQEMGNVILSYREVQASLNNLEKIFQIPIEVKPQNPTKIDKIEKLAFEQVSFKHKTAKSKALTNISFEVNKGETIAFVGPSGSGKTTLVKLLVGLYSPLEGRILYNDIDCRNIDIEELRHQIGFVTQDTQLFAGTIKENLLFVKPQATDEQIIDVLNKSACSNLLARADNGINTFIGEGGMKISGGEKQRLSIARALLRHPNLVVFDEATSSLDSITEEEITNTIKKISTLNSHITVMIAHRLSTIMHADNIYVLEKGIIVETGKHADLLEDKGLYYAMWRQQIGERKEELHDDQTLVLS